MSNERAFAADMAIEEQRRAWDLEHTPKAHAVRERARELLTRVSNEEARKSIDGLIFMLDTICTSGQDMDSDYWGEPGFEAEVEIWLKRAEP